MKRLTTLYGVVAVAAALAVQPVLAKDCLAKRPSKTCDTSKEKKCFIDITIKNGEPEVSALQLKVKGPNPVRIVWRLKGPKDNFVGAENDGTWFTNKTQFSDNYHTDAANDDKDHKPKGKKYHWHFANDIKNTGNFKYSVKFRNDDGKEFTCDPTINNEGAGS